jgi:hypothetical protein
MRKKYREQYFENYLLKTKIDGKRHKRKVLTYTGKWMRWKLSTKDRWDLRNIYLGSLILGITLFLLSGLQHHVINTLWFVSAPATISLVPLLIEIIGITQFLFSKEAMTSLDSEEIHKRIYFGALFHSIFLLLTVTACITALTHIGASLATLMITIGYLFCGLCSGLVFFLQRRILIEEIPKPPENA